jgi:hypothetical protein
MELFFSSLKTYRTICLCLSIIDQYFSTWSYPRLQQLSNIKVSHRMLIITILFCAIHNIPFFIYYNHIVSTTGKISCTYTNYIFQQYTTYVYGLFLGRILPMSIILLFCLLTYININKITNRRLPIFRRELDKQLTKMIFCTKYC